MKRLTPEIKLNIQLGIAIVLVTAGLVLLFCGFWTAPQGEIHNSVLVAFGECCTFSGSLIGVDYHYRYKTYDTYRRHHPHHPGMMDDDNYMDYEKPNPDETLHDQRDDA